MRDAPALPSAWPGLMRPIATAHELILNRLNQMSRDPRYAGDIEELKLAQQTILDLERDLAAANAERESANRAIDLAARAMCGEGVEDQGQAWDKCLRILNAAIAGKEKPNEQT